MDEPIVVAATTLVILLVLLTAGIEIAAGLAIAAVLGLYIFKGSGGLARLIPFAASNSFVLTAIPLFIFMGDILLRCGASERIYRGTSRILAWAPGGLLHANIGSCALFASVCGSSPATASTIGTVAIPELSKRGYDMKLTLGSLAAGGTLGILIPPSITMIVYGMLAEASVGSLFAGGVIPGVILAIMFMIYAAIRTVRNPAIAPTEASFSTKGMVLGFLDLWPVAILMFIVLGGIFGGVFTPTEAAAVGSISALLMALCMRRYTWQDFRASLRTAMEIACMVMFIVVAASLLSGFLAVTDVPRSISTYVLSIDLPGAVVLIFIYLLYVVLGCFIDGISAMVLTLPVILPIVTGLGYDPIWFGVVLVVLCEVGMITPPMGINLFVIQGISKRDLHEVIAGSAPFFLIMLIGIALMTIFPLLVLWLPSLTRGA
jgi:tripartite ATP-independent transporter DctM subunit